MMLSDEKVTHLSHILLKGLMEKDLIKLKDSEAAARKVIKRVINTELQEGQAIDTGVRRKLESYSRKIVEGSPEWEVLYRKFYQEEEAKRGRAEG